MPTSSPIRFNLLGVGVDALDYATAVTTILDAARHRRPLAVTALAVHGVMTGRTDPAQRARLNALDIVTPDGQPVRWALNWLHRTRLDDRVYGPFLMLRLCERAAAEGIGVFLFGSERSNLDTLSASLTARFPGLRIVGTQPSRFRRATPGEWAADIATLRESGAGIVFCGLGCPRQETWVYEMRDALSCPLIAVGAAFAFWSGRQRMAPAWMQRLGLEWAFRFSQEPARLWYRYLVYNPLYVVAVLAQKLVPGAYEYRPPATPPAAEHWG